MPAFGVSPTEEFSGVCVFLLLKTVSWIVPTVEFVGWLAAVLRGRICAGRHSVLSIEFCRYEGGESDS